MNWPQPPTPIQVDNSAAVGIANQSIKQKIYKAMDMRLYWVIDRIKQGQFKAYWRPGSTHLADYPTKHHSTEHHIKVRPLYLHEPRGKNSTVQGFVNSSTISQPSAVNVRPGLLNQIRQYALFYRYFCQSINKKNQNISTHEQSNSNQRSLL